MVFGDSIRFIQVVRFSERAVNALHILYRAYERWWFQIGFDTWLCYCCCRGDCICCWALGSTIQVQNAHTWCTLPGHAQMLSSPNGKSDNIISCLKAWFTLAILFAIFCCWRRVRMNDTMIIYTYCLLLREIDLFSWVFQYFHVVNSKQN
jgi:hypothetical protein